MKIRFLVRTTLLILLGYVHLGAATDQTFDIQVKFSNVRNTNGRIQLQIYRSQEAFAGEKPWKVIQVPKDSWKDKGFSYKVTGIPAGTYGIAILDDENSSLAVQPATADAAFRLPLHLAPNTRRGSRRNGDGGQHAPRPVSDCETRRDQP